MDRFFYEVDAATGHCVAIEAPREIDTHALHLCFVQAGIQSHYEAKRLLIDEPVSLEKAVAIATPQAVRTAIAMTPTLRSAPAGFSPSPPRVSEPD